MATESRDVLARPVRYMDEPQIIGWICCRCRVVYVNAVVGEDAAKKAIACCTERDGTTLTAPEGSIGSIGVPEDEGDPEHEDPRSGTGA